MGHRKHFATSGSSWLFLDRKTPVWDDTRRGVPRIPPMQKDSSSKNTAKLAFGALGVVYGDIGTSPLYAVKECFGAGGGHGGGTGGLEVIAPNVVGVLSLIIWALILIVTIKYVIFILSADNRGEGGILALMALVFPPKEKIKGRFNWVVMGIGIFGAALLYGDGMITPAISVLSAVEGLSVATPLISPDMIRVITIVIIVGLFSVQRRGTESVGKIFGPVTFVWFLVLAGLGIKGIMMNPAILAAFNPWYGVDFLIHHGAVALMVMGAVFLVCTGGEALYADMGHFGAKPIRFAWFTLVLPALLLNYLGQGALLLSEPEAASNPFYKLAPGWMLYPLVLLATCATVIASQALISGAFSLTMQAIQLGYLPRLRIDHTSAHERGQIYMPHVNWLIMIGAVGLVLGFKSSGALAAAYGVAVIITMTATTILFFLVASRLWKWPLIPTLLLCLVFFLVELSFLFSNLLKIPHGGWFPVLMGTLVYITMVTWKKGRAIVYKRLKDALLPLPSLIESVTSERVHRVKGVAVYLSGSPDGVPMALLHNLKHNQVLHEKVIILHMATEETPHVDPVDRLQWEDAGNGFYRIHGHFGFMQEPNVLEVLGRAIHQGLDIDMKRVSYFLSRENLVKGPGGEFWGIRKELFMVLARNARNPAQFFRLPANRVVEFGVQVQL
jgi:KUP system potassium uptake protein